MINFEKTYVVYVKINVINVMLKCVVTTRKAQFCRSEDSNISFRIWRLCWWANQGHDRLWL